ncbi:MAG: response regulator [bacterium]
MPKNVFIVEDEIDLMEFYVEALELSGHIIVGCARNGAEAVEKFLEMNEHPDVIIMDYRMPVKSGIEATREILNIDPSVKVIFASADYSVEPEAMSMGVAAFKRKPFTYEELIKSIEEI